MAVQGILNDKYELISEVANDGVFITVNARKIEDDAHYIIKILNPEFAEDKHIISLFRELVEQEFTISQNHLADNIVKIGDYGCDGKLNYIVLDCYGASPLQDYLNNDEILAPKQAASIVLQLAKSLSNVHPRGIVHGNITPSSIYVTEDGTAMLTDFGFDRLIPLIKEFYKKAKKEVPNLTANTIRYRTPEQLNGFGIEGRTDIFALGVLLYRLTTGCYPFDSNNEKDLLILHATKKPEQPSLFNTAISEDLEKIIYRALSYNADSRYKTIDTFSIELEYYIQGSSMLSIIHTPIAVEEHKVKPKKEPTQAQLRKKKARLNSLLLNFFIVVVSATLLVVLSYGFFQLAKTVYELNFVTKSVTVPNVVGKTEDEARDLLKSKQLIYRKVESIYSSTVKKDCVIEQNILPGETVNEDTLVDVVVSLGAFVINIPNCIGKDISTAQLELISNQYIVIGKYTYVESDQPKDIIVGQSIAAGPYSLDGNDVTIYFEISSGPNTNVVEIPNLVGYTLTSAQQFASIKNIKIGKISYDYSDTVKKDVIISQSIPAGTNVSSDTKLNLVVSLGKKVYVDKTVTVSLPTSIAAENGDMVNVVVKVLQTVGNKSEFVDILTTQLTVNNGSVAIELSNAGTETYYFYVNGTFVTNKTVVFN